MARRETADQQPADPGLPFKRRARRRLVGALIIGLGVAVTLPLVLDREPRYPRPDIRVDIPSRDAQLPVRAQGDAESSAATASRAPVSADSTRAARAEAGRVAEARSTAGAASADPAQAAAEARQQSREPMTQQLDVPTDGAAPPRGTAPKADADAARAAAGKADAARAEAQRQEAARAEAQRQEAARAEAARANAVRAAEAARAEAARADAARAQAAASARPPAETAAQARAYPSQNWAVQIGQFARPENARAAESRAGSLGLRAYSETLQTAQGERVRVRAGPFATRAAAEEARSRLLAAGLEAALIAPEAGR